MQLGENLFVLQEEIQPLLCRDGGAGRFGEEGENIQHGIILDKNIRLENIDSRISRPAVIVSKQEKPHETEPGWPGQHADGSGPARPAYISCRLS